ncbi:Hypothetical protein APO_2102 [Acetobacter pomorum DM001]|uniref:Uncharacterized protein n=1 Tax=Acetobacter pomorum DM001 TaxID=945681 RepID=F1YVV8_9PROT|nr:Hypothetical protein APO_2102 [Acetobacter pomorum DM001]
MRQPYFTSYQPEILHAASRRTGTATITSTTTGTARATTATTRSPPTRRTAAARATTSSATATQNRRTHGGSFCFIRVPRMIPNHRHSFANGAFNIAQPSPLFCITEGNSPAITPGTCCTTNAVHVAFRHVWQIVIKHVADIVHINTAGGNIRCHQHFNRTRTEALHGPLTRTLRLVAMNGFCHHVVLVQKFRNLVGFMLHEREHHSARNLGRFHHVQQRIALITRAIYKHDGLLNTIHRAGRRRHFNACRIIQQRCRQIFNAARHGGGEQKRLALFWHKGHDTADIAHKPHIQHAVCFIQHQNFQTRQINKALAHQIKQTARRSHQHIYATTHGFNLSALPHATKHNGLRKLHMACVSFKAIANLGHKLTRRRQHQNARLFGRVCTWVFNQMFQNRQRKRCGFACACLGQAQQITPLQQIGDGTFLNRSGCIITLLCQCLQQWWSKSKIGKFSHQGQPYLCSLKTRSRDRTLFSYALYVLWRTRNIFAPACS